MRSRIPEGEWNNYYSDRVNSNSVAKLRILLVMILLTINYMTWDHVISNPVRNYAISTEIKQERVKFEVLATKYNPVSEQCWSNPLITADMSRIDTSELRQDKIRWIAVSRDLLKEFSYGDKVLVECDNPNLCGKWEIHDCMNKRFTMCIDFLVPLNDNLEFHKPIKAIIYKL